MNKRFIKRLLKIATYTAKSSLKVIPTLLVLSAPYLGMYTVYAAYNSRGYFSVGSEVLIPVLPLLVARFFAAMAEEFRIGNDIPVPRKRFTTRYKDGTVNIDKADVQEMIVYQADLEDWMEKKGRI